MSFIRLFAWACVVPLAWGFRQQVKHTELDTDTEYKSFAASLMLSGSVLDKVARQELPSIIAALELDDQIHFDPATSSIRAEPISGSHGAVHAVIENITVKKWRFVNLKGCSLTLDLRVNESKGELDILNLDIIPGEHQKLSTIPHLIAKPFQMFLHRTALGAVRHFVNSRLKAVACYKMKYTVRIKQFEADSVGTVGVGLTFTLPGAEEVRSHPVPLQYMRRGEQESYESATKVGFYWSDAMITVLADSPKTESWAHWLLSTTMGSEDGGATQWLASTWPMRKVAAKMMNSLLYATGVAKHPNIESLLNVVYRVQDGGLSGVVSVVDLGNNGAGIMDSIFPDNDEKAAALHDYWDSPSHFKYNKECKVNDVPHESSTTTISSPETASPDLEEFDDDFLLSQS